MDELSLVQSKQYLNLLQFVSYSEEPVITTWKEVNPDGVGNVKLGKKLTNNQVEQIQKLLGEYTQRVNPDLRTHLTEDHIRTTEGLRLAGGPGPSSTTCNGRSHSQSLKLIRT